jgi:hypothetical protein
MNLPSFDFTNWREHPTDNRYEVYFFKNQYESEYFRNLLQENQITFEFHQEEENPEYRYFFAINKRDSKEVITLNHLTIGHFRKPFISNKILRYGLVTLMFVVLLLGIIGYSITQ